MAYRIKELASLAGVSVRTLHHYDRIGLLAPQSRNASGYRLYGEAELFRLQQILLYREMELPLGKIGELLDRADFDFRNELARHRRSIEEKAARLAVLLTTIDKTIARLGGETNMLSDEELYEGFDKSEIEEIKAESAKRWGDTAAYKESQRRVARMSAADWATVKEEGGAVDQACSAAFKAGKAPGSPEVQRLMARKAEHLRTFYEPSAEMFKGLGEMYVADERFKRTYDKIATGLAEYLREAMAVYAASGMKN